MKRKGFFAFAPGSSYAPAMTDSELWKAVGRVLEERRLALGYGFTSKVKKEHRGAPTANTLKEIEAGRPGNVASLSDYCEALGLKLPEVIAGVLPKSEMTVKQRTLLRLFVQAEEWLQETTLETLRKHLAAKPKPQGDGKVEPAKKPSRSERSR